MLHACVHAEKKGMHVIPWPGWAFILWRLQQRHTGMPKLVRFRGGVCCNGFEEPGVASYETHHTPYVIKCNQCFRCELLISNQFEIIQHVAVIHYDIAA